MDWSFLLAAEGPHHHVLQGDGEALAETLRAFGRYSEHGLMVRWLRGAKMRSPQGVLDEFSAALQFPPYFGDNWDALDECLNDLEWLEGDCAVLVILDAEQVLQDVEPTEARILFDILNAEVSDVPVHLVYQVAAEGQTLQEGLTALGLRADLIKV